MGRGPRLPFPIDLSNPEAVIAEKRRRDERRHAGLPLHAAAVEKSSDKKPRLSMLRWSQAMREAGDMVGLVFRPGLYDADAPHVIEIDWAKMRDLEPFKAHLKWTGKFMLVEDL